MPVRLTLRLERPPDQPNREFAPAPGATVLRPESVLHQLRLFENRILSDFVGDHVFQLHSVELKDGDHLHQAWCEYLLLLYTEVQALRKRTHVVLSLTPETAFRR
jgi:hypothetical protein